MDEQEIIRSEVDNISEAISLIESQVTELNELKKSYTNTPEDLGKAFIIRFLATNLEHYTKTATFLCLKATADQTSSFFLLPVLRQQLETFATIMTLRLLKSEERCTTLMNEHFIQLAKLQKKEKTDSFENQYREERKKYALVIDEYGLEIPFSSKDLTNKKIDLIKPRLPDSSSMCENLPETIKGLATRNIFKVSDLRHAYTLLSLYSHGNAMFINKSNREVFWIISSMMSASLFISEMLDTDYLFSTKKHTIQELLLKSSLRKTDLFRIWNERG